MPTLRSPIDALRYALASRQQAQETGRSIGAPIGAGISRGIGLAEDRRRDKAAEAYRNAQMAQRQSEFGTEQGRHAREFEAEQKHRDEMLRLKKEEMYGGRTVPGPELPPERVGWDFSQGPTGTMPKGPVPEGTYAPRERGEVFEPTVESMKAAAEAGRKDRGEERADTRTDYARRRIELAEKNAGAAKVNPRFAQIRDYLRRGEKTYRLIVLEDQKTLTPGRKKFKEEYERALDEEQRMLYEQETAGHFAADPVGGYLDPR